ncbi:MFS transporter [Rhodanobacter sp. AS-Z3]|uniref:MFS transporter n=1 Tax=Rhodanobacter sp. AS-Z3 TaxID=3031330 RepID=UPI0024788BD2|nr:MFS transporter [Rhodanobacter sp. AS-Z3]WEN16497.1 MFS transporter [Rhodanobacter sp. AS-Z3]
MHDDQPHSTWQAPAEEASSAEPGSVGWGFVAAYAACYTGLWMALLSPILVGLTLRVRVIDPLHAAGSLSLVMSAGALLAMFGNPFFGQLSDRTTSRFGMRRPWLIVGALGGLVGLALVAQAVSIPQLLLGWCITQLAFNAQLAALVAILSDQVPRHQRGTVSGVVGISMPVGMVGGTFLVQMLADSTLAMFLVPGALAVVSALGLAWVLPDRTLPAGTHPRYALRDFLGSFWIRLWRFPDFGWAWSSRFLFFAGVSVLLTYQGFYLITQLGRAPAEVAHLILLSTLVQSGALVIFSGVVGRWSDAIGRRKVFVSTAALIYTLALLVIAFADSYGGFLLGMAISGAGQGMYQAVDLALVTDVLPQRETHAARNLGIFNIASVMPQSLVPALAPLILVASHGTYTALFVVAAGLVALGAWAIQPVRAVR